MKLGAERSPESVSEGAFFSSPVPVYRAEKELRAVPRADRILAGDWQRRHLTLDANP
jgi:hypothetical protein